MSEILVPIVLVGGGYLAFKMYQIRVANNMLNTFSNTVSNIQFKKPPHLDKLRQKMFKRPGVKVTKVKSILPPGGVSLPGGGRVWSNN